jgi:hypothetical protein
VRRLKWPSNPVFGCKPEKHCSVFETLRGLRPIATSPPPIVTTIDECASLTSPRCLVLSRGAAMRRRSRAGGEATKAQCRKTAVRKSGSAPKAVRPRSSSAAGQQTKLVQSTCRCRNVASHQPLDIWICGPWGRTQPLVEPTARLCHANSASFLRRKRESAVSFCESHQVDRACDTDQPDLNIEGRCNE